MIYFFVVCCFLLLLVLFLARKRCFFVSDNQTPIMVAAYNATETDDTIKMIEHYISMGADLNTQTEIYGTFVRYCWYKLGIFWLPFEYLFKAKLRC